MKGNFNAIQFFLFILLGFLLHSCVNKENASINPLIGKWVSPYGHDTYWEFTSDENVTFFNSGRVIPGNETYGTSKAGEPYEETVYGPLKYNYSLSMDTIKIETYGSLNHKPYMRYASIREGNKLYIWNYKTLPGIENHIDEVSHYCLESMSCSNTPERLIKVVIEQGLKGPVHISFDQKDGIPPKYDASNNPVINIDQGTIHKTTLPWHPSYMTDNAFDFKVKQCTDSTISDMNDWGHSRYRAKLTDMYQSDTVTFRSKDYELSAFSLGFNQYPRDKLDYEFREYLNGQVASFNIGYLSDQFEYKEYMKKVKALGEEIKG